MTETTPDYAGLIERLEKVEPDTPGEGVTRYYRNPDGPGAAAALRTLLERNEALERERDELKHDVSRYIEIASDEATRAEAAEAQLAEARKALEASASALEEAREDVEHWGSYAGEYFQDKHDLDGDLDRIARQASAARRALTGGTND